MKLSCRLLSILLLAWLEPCLAEDLSADKVKSAYVLNFARFAEWPDGTAWADDKVRLCVVGSNVLGGALMELDGRKAGSRELHVVQYANVASGLNGCHVVFIGASEEPRFVSILQSLDDFPVLTISDIEDFAEKGGDVGLRYRESKIVFEANLAAMQKSKLRLPGQLLNLAAHVFGR